MLGYGLITRRAKPLPLPNIFQYCLFQVLSMRLYSGSCRWTFPLYPPFSFFKTDLREREMGGREREICCSTYLCIHLLILVCALTEDRTYNLGVSGRCSNQLSYWARAFYPPLPNGFYPLFCVPVFLFCTVISSDLSSKLAAFLVSFVRITV